MRGHLDVIKYLIEVHKCDILARNCFGDTPLHYACTNGQLNAVKFLVEKYLWKRDKNDFLFRNEQGFTPQQIAYQKGHSFIAAYLKSMADSYFYICSIMVIGNSGAGKSTFIKSLTSEKSFFGHYFTVKGVTPSTPGIVPCKMKREGMGQFNIYDFSGHEDYYASHEMFLQHTRYPLVIVVFDVSLPFSDIQTQLSFWVNVILNFKNSYCFNVLLVASHIDQCSNRNIQGIDHFFSNLVHSSELKYHGLVEGDCRYSISREMTSIISKITAINETIAIDFMKDTSDFMYKMCASLIFYLRENKEKYSPTTMTSKLIEDIQTSGINNSLLTELSDKKQLIETCKSLSLTGHILYFPSETIENEGLLVMDEEFILGKVHASLKHIKEGIVNDIGMLEESELKSILVRSDVVPKNPEMAIKYLVFSQFCTHVSKDSIIPSSKLNNTKTDYYFFPNLVNSEAPPEVFINTDEYTNIYSWIGECPSRRFFTPRCIHCLFIHLVKFENTTNTARHDIWKHGILIVSGNQVRSVIEFSNQTSCITLLMQCHQDHQHELVEERAKLVAVIRSVIGNTCPNFKMSEYLLHSQKYPLKELAKIPIIELANYVFHNKSSVPVRGQHDRTITSHSLPDILCVDSIQVVETSHFEIIFKNKDSNMKIPDYLSYVINSLRKYKQLRFKSCTFIELYQNIVKLSIFYECHFAVSIFDIFKIV